MKILHFCWTTFGNEITYWKKWPSRLRVKTPHIWPLKVNHMVSIVSILQITGHAMTRHGYAILGSLILPRNILLHYRKALYGRGSKEPGHGVLWWWCMNIDGTHENRQHRAACSKIEWYFQEKTSIRIKAWISNYSHLKQWDVITHPCPNFTLKLGHRWVITSHTMLLLLIHVLILVIDM